MYKRRHIESVLKKLAPLFKVILITGARQVGKSTLLRNVFPGTPVVTFEPVKDILNARKDPELFLQNHSQPLILDEIQYAPELLATLKRVVDESDTKPQYFMTGSQNLSMLKSVTESMAGRVGIIHLSSLTPYEQGEHTQRPSWLEHYLNNPDTLKDKVVGTDTTTTLVSALWRGGMPGFLQTPDELLNYQIGSYISTYIERDIRSFIELESLTSFEQFFGIIAALSAQEINYSHLGRELSISNISIKRWLGLLEQSYQWRTIPAYHGNAIKRVTSKKKGYLTDTGIACYLQHISSPQALLNHPLRGALFETFVANIIHALIGTLPFRPAMYHWRSNGGAEVDLVLTINGELYPIEMKMTSSLSKYDARGIEAFRQTYHSPRSPVRLGLIIYAGSQCHYITENVLALPWNVLCKP